MIIPLDIQKITSSLEEKIKNNTFNIYIQDLVRTNSKLVDFYENPNNNYQTMLLSGPFGSGKTHSLMALKLRDINLIKNLISEYHELEEEQINNLNNIKDITTLYDFINTNSLGNMSSYINSFNNMMFINVERILYANDWIKTLYNEIVLQLLNHNPEYIDLINGNNLLPNVKIENLGEKLLCFENGRDLLKYSKEFLKPLVNNISIPLSWKFIKLGNLTFEEEKIEYNIELIVELLDTITTPKITFVFENLDRVNGDKVLNFLSQFNLIFQHSYVNIRKFIFTLDKNELLQSINRENDKTGYLTKYFDIESKLCNFNDVKLSMLKKCTRDNDIFVDKFGKDLNLDNIRHYLLSPSNSITTTERKFISTFFKISIRELEKEINNSNKLLPIIKNFKPGFTFEFSLIQTNYQNMDKIDKFWNSYLISNYFINSLITNKFSIAQLYTAKTYNDNNNILDLVLTSISLTEIGKYFDINLYSLELTNNIDFGEKIMKNISNK